MQRLIAFILLFTFTFNVFASTGTLQELEKSLDEYQYALTVEWDQKDMQFQEAQSKILFAKISALMAQGLTSAEIVKLAEQKISNKETLAAMRVKLAMAGEVKSSEELAKLLSDTSKDFYKKGASWSGSIDATTALFVIAGVALLAYAVWFSATHECVAWDQRWDCTENTYYDDYGSYTDSSCGWEDYCVEWVKK